MRWLSFLVVVSGFSSWVSELNSPKTSLLAGDLMTAEFGWIIGLNNFLVVVFFFGCFPSWTQKKVKSLLQRG